MGMITNNLPQGQRIPLASTAQMSSVRNKHSDCLAKKKKKANEMREEEFEAMPSIMPTVASYRRRVLSESESSDWENEEDEEEESSSAQLRILPPVALGRDPDSGLWLDGPEIDGEEDVGEADDYDDEYEYSA